MATEPGAAPPPSLALNTEHAQSQMQMQRPVASDALSNRTSATNSPLSSAPPTPNPNTPRRPSHPATSPLHTTAARSPSALRRTSSATGLNERPTSSPNLMRKSSRTSLGAPGEDSEKRPTPKRSISNLITGLREAQTRMEAIEEPVPLTAAQVAVQHFTRELLTDLPAETVVLLHDACYGHRYARLKTTKTTLSMIVERPERIHAAVLGASAAYVRLAGHHAGGKNVPHPDRAEVAAPPFRIRRTRREVDITSSYVTNVHGTAWMAELRGLCNVAGERLAAGVKELDRSNTPTEPEKRKLHEGDLYLSSESLSAFQGALGGVADAVDSVFEPGSRTRRAFVAIRPPGHHCSADHPSGFCWLNNVHIGIEYAAQTHGLTHAVILDFDLHHGDGSQAITWQRNSRNNVKRLNAKPNSKLKLGPDIGYYSLHDINSYPCEMGDDEKVQAASLCLDNAHGQSVWNVHLQPWKTEAEFWNLYETRYRVLLDKARAFLLHHTARLKAEGKTPPKSAVFISAGFDASEWEGAGMQRHKVNVPTEFYARFTRDVVELAREGETACDGRVISVLEGGYSDRALCSGVLSHLSGLCTTPVDEMKKEGAGMESLDQMMRGLGINGISTSTYQYDKAWWSEANLTTLELKVNPPPPPGQGKKVRTGQAPTYATPTESFAYKVVDANKFARSISGTMREIPVPPRPPTPPVPEVDWVVATQELSKLLIPTERQTRSCSPEELAVVKTKKEPPTSVIAAGSTEDPTKPRQLRDRKAKTPAYPESAHSDELESVRSASRNSNRRQTIADFPLAASAAQLPDHGRQRRASRRLSAGSALSSVAGDLEEVVPAVPAVTAKTMPPPPLPPTASNVQVKKPRASAGKPKPDAPSSAPVSPGGRRVSKAPTRLSGPGPGASGNDVDALTSGMKKVTLKVGTKEEHDRKQKEKLDAERRARGLKAAETRRVNAAARKAAGLGAVPTKAGPEPDVKENTTPLPPEHGEREAVGKAEKEIAAPTAGEFISSEIQPKTEPVEVEAQAMFPTYAAADWSGTSASTTSPASTALHPQPNTFALPEAQHTTLSPPVLHTKPPVSNGTHVQPSNAPPVFPNEVLQPPTHPAFSSTAPFAQPAPTATSHIPPKPTNGLPSWSSTGFIPFAPPAADKGPALNGGLQSDGVMNGVDESGAMAASGAREDTEKVKAEGEGVGSVWDVPETPQR